MARRPSWKQTKMIIAAAVLAAGMAGFWFLWRYFPAAFGSRPGTGPAADRYYLNRDAGRGDAYVTLEPQLKDILAGPIITALDPIWGRADAPVTVVIYADFRCDFCREQEAVIRRVAAAYQGRVSVLWKDYPEADEQSLSFRAAVAARCAQAEGKFWEYHDRLFADRLDTESVLSEAAAGLGLPTSRFDSCRAGEEAAKRVRDDMAEAEALGITGVPFLYINDIALLGSVSEEELRTVIDAALAKAPEMR